MLSAVDRKIATEIVGHLEIPRDFGLDEYGGGFIFGEDDYILYRLHSYFPDIQFELITGCSKAVIISDELPFVIKIPFNGVWYEKERYDEESEPEYYFDYFHFNKNNEPTDYCEIELHNTIKAKVEGFREFFPDINYLGRFGDTRFYIQEKVQNIKMCPFKLSNDGLTWARSIGADKDQWDYFICNEEWRAAVYDLYGKEKLFQLVDWAVFNKLEWLNDLHSGNYGFSMDGKPIILDVSGFFE